jgi:Lamin Tail Domain
MNSKLLAGFLFFLFVSLYAKSQVKDDFSDGDFTNNPGWTGNTSDFIVDDSFRLRSNNMVPNSHFYLSTANTRAVNTEWEMNLQMDFNPSGLNFIDVYLIASSQDLIASNINGYFVRLGNTSDEISLFRKDPDGSITKIIDGEDGVLNSGSNQVKLKVSRDSTGRWILFRDLSVPGNSLAKEGEVVDTTYMTSAFFGILIHQSTASFFKKHFFDNIEIKKLVPDTSPPEIKSVSVLSDHELNVLFSEPVEDISGQLTSNYSVLPLIGDPLYARKDPGDNSKVILTLGESLNSGILYSLSVTGVQDLHGNMIQDSVIYFRYVVAQPQDIVIDEIMADPSPPVELPEQEWIELRNISTYEISLKNWRLSDASHQSGPMPDFVLQPDSFLIICSHSAYSALTKFGNVLAVDDFPILNNSSDLLSLRSSDGRVIHAVKYSQDWYHDTNRENGGWSLEMIDAKNPCIGSGNWKSSESSTGGTPGKINSVDGINENNTVPRLLRAYLKGMDTLILVFSESLDSSISVNANNYSIDNNLVAVKIITETPLFDRVLIKLNQPVVPGKIYSVTAKGVSDCVGNKLQMNNTTKFGIPEKTNPFDIVINEVLFNPKPFGEDFVEIYNRSKKILDLSTTKLANRNSSDLINDEHLLADESYLFFPGDFLVLTIDPDAVKNQYITNNPDGFLKLGKMPSFPDNGGEVVLLNEKNEIVDEVDYSDQWHYPLITNTEGVSLERMRYDDSSDINNFHSAAASVGYATPAYKNSQSENDILINEYVHVTPEIFSPDNDGMDDYATITYKFPAPGYVVNSTIFDASGRQVRLLQQNSLSGTSGFFQWDGLDNNKRPLPRGIYIIFTEVFDTKGQVRRFKSVVVLARKNL